MDSDSSSDDESADDATELDVVEVCVAELLDFMTIRAAENTQAFVILMEMRFSEIIFLLQRSEYAANADMYCTGMKYALLLAVNSNAYKYVKMICNFFVERTCMSDCQRKVLDEFVMFRRTKYGKYIYSDRSVEWVMRDIRQYLGKYFKQSTTDQLRRLLMQMHEVKDLKNTSSGSNTIMSLGRKCRIKIDRAFLEPYMFCISSNLWCGTPMSIVNKPYKSRIDANGEENGRVPFEDPTMLHNTSGEVLYADILSLHSRGLQRAKEYYEKWHRTGDVAQASRPTSQVNLKMVKIDNKQLEKEYEMCVCLDETKINKDRQLYTSSRVLAELNLLLEELDDKELEWPDLPRNWNNVSKKVPVAALVTARKTLRLNDPINWETATKEVFKSRYEGQCTDPSEIVRDE